jgi:predicted 3-demethylubiquinone-9 3-methyltransferase (glyoxalase superfamily)
VATITQKITPFLWFDTQAEQAAEFYTSVFENSRIKQINRYGHAGKDTHGLEAGTVMTVEFEICGQTFMALNGGPLFKFSEAISFAIACESQDEIDYFWTKLSQGGEESRCGWLKDKYGLSWQVVPAALPQILRDADAAARDRVMDAVLKMKKFDLQKLKQAYKGEPQGEVRGRRA